MAKIGEIGEQIVGEWLETQGWQILHHRWRCRWGEIDLIMQEKSSLFIAFVEIKTRSSRNWDENGILAITPEKQAKLIETAQAFLSKYPHFADFPCRFDVALVHYQPAKLNHFSEPIQLKKPIFRGGYQLTIKSYIESAFDYC